MIKLNGEKIKPTIFPDGTSQIWQIDFLEKYDPFCQIGKPFVDIEFYFHSEAEVFQLFQLLDLVCQEMFNPEIKLHIPFLPYGRQDKDISNNSTFALHTFGRMLSTYPNLTVYTVDAHSYILNQYVKFESIYPTASIDSAISESKANTIAFPDVSAFNRYEVVLPSVYFNKVREESTGYIKSLELVGDQNIIKDKNILIIDDICDGGMTFILTAKKLYELDACGVNLYTTHGIYSKGLKPLKNAGIKQIFNLSGEVK